MSGILYLVSTPIGNLDEISKRQVDTLKLVDVVACENPNNSLKLLSKLDIKKKLIQINAIHEIEMSSNAIKILKSGQSVAFLSDAGYPCVSDPGSVLVSLAIENDIKIVVINGSSAMLTALIASGLDTSKFSFLGFLSSKKGTRKNSLLKYKDCEETLIIYESSHRIADTLKILLEVFGNRKVCIARELTKLHEEYIRGTLETVQNLSESQLKGEFVIILDGQKDTKNIDEKTLLDEVFILTQSGTKTKAAVSLVADKYNYSKNKLYNLYIKK